MVKGLVVGLLVLGFVAGFGCAASTTPRAASTPVRPGPAATVDGVWEGVLVGRASLRVIVKIKREAAGWTATLDSPDQGVRGLPVDSVALLGDTVRLELTGIKAGYEARLVGEKLVGTWTQSGHATTLDLKKRTALTATTLDGAWLGAIRVGVMSLPLVFTIQRKADGWSATLDSPDQNMPGVAADSVSFQADNLKLVLSKIDASYEARLEGDALIGTFTQKGVALPLELEKTTRPPIVRLRPQNPRLPLPYDEIDVRVENPAAGATLACTLTEPRGRGPFGAVVLAVGSGPNDRDESIKGHRPFLVLSDAITRSGVAVLRCDKRGVAKSTGTLAKATVLDFANDVLAEVAALRSRPEIDRAHIGVAGHSEGSTVAAIAAAKSRDVAFIVLLAGPALPGDQIIALQLAWAERTAGASEQAIATKSANEKSASEKSANDRIYAIVKAEQDDAAAARKLRAYYDGLPAAHRAQIMEQVGGFDAMVANLLSPYFRTYISLDPRTFLAQVRVPVLALNGSRDIQVASSANLPEMARALARDHDVTVLEMPGLNHLFQNAKTGALAEYGEIEETMSPAVLTLVSDWIARHAK